MDLDLRTFDALMPLLGILGLWPALVLLFRSTSPNPAERRLKVVLTFIALALGFRALYVSTESPFFGMIVYALFTATLFQLFLFYETLLRRHFPLALKIFMSAGCVLFLILALFGMMPEDALTLYFFLAFVFIGQAWTLLITFKRDRDDYSGAENKYIDLIVITLCVLSPFFFTDITSIDFGDLPRMGTLGALFFTYIAINAEQLFERSKSFYSKSVKVVLFSLALTFTVLSLLPHQPGPVQTRIFVLFLCVNLIFRIYYAVKHITGSDTLSRFLERLQESQKKTRDEFLDDMDQVFEGIRKTLLTSTALNEDERLKIIEIFASRQTSVFSIYELRQIVEEPDVTAGTSQAELETIELMIHLLQEKKMNHFCLVDPEEGIFLLFDLIALGYGRQIRLQAGFSVEMARLVKAASTKS